MQIEPSCIYWDARRPLQIGVARKNKIMDSMVFIEAWRSGRLRVVWGKELGTCQKVSVEISGMLCPVRLATGYGRR